MNGEVALAAVSACASDGTEAADGACNAGGAGSGFPTASADSTALLTNGNFFGSGYPTAVVKADGAPVCGIGNEAASSCAATS